MEEIKKLVTSKKFSSKNIQTLLTKLSKTPAQLASASLYVLDNLIPDQVDSYFKTLTGTTLKSMDNNSARQICEEITSKITQAQLQSVVVMLVDASLKEELAEIYQAKGLYQQAASILSKSHIDHPSRNLNEKQRAQKYIQIAEYYLEEENTADANYQLGKVSALGEAGLDSLELQLRFNVCLAREQDLKRNFHAAALNFYRLSNSPGVDEADLLELLKMCTVCAVLLEAGPRKSRLMATLMKDPRMNAENVPLYDLMNSLNEGKIVKMERLKEIQELFKVHQLVKGKFEMTLLQKVIIEHNMLSLGQYFENISLKRMAQMVGLDTNTTQDILAEMIEGDRLEAVIDEIDGFVEFEPQDPDARDAMQWKQFEGQVAGICKSIQDIIDLAQSQ